MKRHTIISLLIVTHLLCMMLGCIIGMRLSTPNAKYETETIPTEVTVEESTEHTTVPEATEHIEETTSPTEIIVETTEATETQDIPVYTPEVTAPPATESQPPATQPAATEPPVSVPPVTESPGGENNTPDQDL